MSKIVCDKARCSGCLACVIACIDQHYDEREVDAVSCRLYEKEVAASGMVCYKTRSCLHCEDAACMAVCPLKVFERSENGFVVAAHRENCVGCRRCFEACPHDVPQFDAKNKVVKCDGCWLRVAHGLEPACVRACNTGCLKLVP